MEFSVLPRLSPFPNIASPFTPLVAANDGRSASLPSQDVDRQTDSLTAADIDWQAVFEADVAAEVRMDRQIQQAHDRGARVIEALYRDNGTAAEHFGEDAIAIPETAFRPSAPSVRCGALADRSAPLGEGADRIFQPGAEFPAFLNRARPVAEDEAFWQEPPPAFPASARMLAIVFLSLVGSLAVLTGIGVAMIAGWIFR